MEWISVEERLPETYEFVLLAFPNGDIIVGCQFDIDEDVVFWRAKTDMGWESDCDFTPTHWMPLPEPPKEG